MVSDPILVIESGCVKGTSEGYNTILFFLKYFEECWLAKKCVLEYGCASSYPRGLQWSTGSLR